jgi:hypothetical protein
MMMIFFEQLVEWIWQGKPKYSEETCPGATLSTTKSHMMTWSRTPDRSGGKPVTNRLSYGTASHPGSRNYWIIMFQQQKLQKQTEIRTNLSGYTAPQKETQWWIHISYKDLEESRISIHRLKMSRKHSNIMATTGAWLKLLHYFLTWQLAICSVNKHTVIIMKWIKVLLIQIFLSQCMNSLFLQQRT